MAYFAAGPLEDYVNQIIENELAEDTAKLLSDMSLKDALKYVWVDNSLDQLKKLSRGHEPIRSSEFKVFIE